MVGTWFGEFCSCCCLPLLSQLAYSILPTTYQPLFPPLYMYIRTKKKNGLNLKMFLILNVIRMILSNSNLKAV